MLPGSCEGYEAFTDFGYSFKLELSNNQNLLFLPLSTLVRTVQNNQIPNLPFCEVLVERIPEQASIVFG
jgi:hypothetical protein